MGKDIEIDKTQMLEPGRESHQGVSLKNILVRMTARARQTQHQASTPEWSHIPVYTCSLTSLYHVNTIHYRFCHQAYLLCGSSDALLHDIVLFDCATTR